jgi:hypothetical protein
MLGAIFIQWINRFLIWQRARKLRRVRTASPLIFLLSGLVAFAGPVNCGYAASTNKASYGTRVKYGAGKKIEFPDFTIEYIGERRTTSPVYPRGFLYYDFKVRKAKAEKTRAPDSLVQCHSKLAGNIISSNYAIPINWET